MSAPARWDLQADVVVAGYGLAGAVSAIEASQAGAKVLLLEKAAHPGGLSILSGGVIKCVSRVEPAVEYFRLLSAQTVDEELVQAFAVGLHENREYLAALCRDCGAELQEIQGTAEEPYGSYPLPGQEAFYGLRVASVPGFEGYPWVQGRSRAAQNLMRVLCDHVERGGVETLFGASATRLTTSADGAVTGLLAESGGRRIALRARRAVILATGGFEQSDWLKLQYLQPKPVYSAAPMTHTGDGILMAQKAGAALWHMWHLHGSYGFKLPEYPVGFRHAYGGARHPRRLMPWIVVDRLGDRYMNEFHPAPQDTGHRPMELFDPDLAVYPRIPSYLVFDEQGCRKGPIAQPVLSEGQSYRWSADNQEEVARGWILRAGSIRELARKIRQQPESGGLMDEERLEATVAAWNAAVERGHDELRRPPGTMMRIHGAPFYAIAAWPLVSNTQGGPVHDVRQRVLDPFGRAIPHLYAVGELGSFFGHLYELSGNLSECLYSGRVAGRSAAAEQES